MRGGSVLPAAFYLEGHVTEIARALLGKCLVTRLNGVKTAGLIVETEAYEGATDRACHAFGRRKTRRNEAMFEEGGRAYVYLCYGLHLMFNVVTNRVGEPDAVLIRAVEPLEGSEAMLARRGMEKIQPPLSSGPGNLAAAMGITRQMDKKPLHGPDLWIEDRGRNVQPDEIASGRRIGVEYAGKDADKPWRFWIKQNPWVSKAKS